MSNINNEDEFVTTQKAKKMLGVHEKTLQNWDKNNKIETIRTPGGRRMYNVNKYIRENNIGYKEEIKKEEKLEKPKKDKENKEDKRKNICYVRVSTVGQKDDLKRQKEYMKNKYPEYEIIEDIGSGINFNRRGLRKIINMSISGEIKTLVVAYKDRLTRFGFELIEDLITEYSKGKIIVENEKEEKEPKEELVEDVLQILNVYTAKLNGLRKYKKDKK